MTDHEAIEFSKLKQPFPADEVKWRIGSTSGDKKRGMALAYIDARNVMERLDSVVGPGRWQNEFLILEDDPRVLCRIGIHLNEWVWKGDGAGPTDIEGEKGGISDAFKRAAVHWGIGRYLYALPAPWVNITKRGNSYTISPSEHERLGAMLEMGSDPEPRSLAQSPPIPTSPSKAQQNATSSLSPPIQDELGNPYDQRTPEFEDIPKGTPAPGSIPYMGPDVPIEAKPTQEGDSPLVTKDRIRELKIWPRLFKLNEQKHGSGDDIPKFKVADEILKHIGIGTMKNFREHHIDTLMAAISNYENTGDPRG